MTSLDIIERAALPCNPIECIQFMTTWNRVSKSRAVVFDNIFSFDIHVSCKSFYYHLFNAGSRDFSRRQTITSNIYSNHRRPQAFGLNFLTKLKQWRRRKKLRDMGKSLPRAQKAH